MLTDIRDHLRDQNVCSLRELSQRFQKPPEVIRSMLSHWLRKGQALRLKSGCIKKCVTCNVEELEFYQWQEKEQLIPMRSVL